MFEEILLFYRMNPSFITVLFWVVAVGAVNAQPHDSNWSVLIGGQGAYAIKAEPTSRIAEANNFLSGYSPAYGVGGLVGLKYAIPRKWALSVNLGVDAHHFSYDLISPLTFGEVGGRTVPGRNLTEYKGVGASWFAELETEISLGSSKWLPVFILRGSLRSWMMEHSNADAAYAAGYQELAGREDSKSQLYYGVGFGVSPFTKNNKISLVYQRTTEPFEPLFEMLVLRQVFKLSNGRSGVQCPTF